MTATKAFQLKDLIAAVEAQPLTDICDAEISGCYISDLLSDVLANGKPGTLWATVQIHRNVVSVACTKDIAAVIFTGNRKPEAEVVMEAEEAGIILLSTKLTTYEVAGKLWQAGLRTS